jgi:hypothetical protein
MDKIIFQNSIGLTPRNLIILICSLIYYWAGDMNGSEEQAAEMNVTLFRHDFSTDYVRVWSYLCFSSRKI